MIRPPTPALHLLPALALLPVGRLVEAPYLVLAIVGVAVTLSGSLRLGGTLVPAALALFAAFAIPMLLALPDAVHLEKSVLTSIGALRFLGASLALLWMLQRAPDPGFLRDRTLHWVGAGTAWLLIIWCLDGLWQFLSGRDVFGFALNEGYINSMFGDGENLKFGLTVALLLPVGLLHALRHWPRGLAVVFLALTLLLLLLSGKRAAWIISLVQLLALGAWYWRRGALTRRRVLAGAAVLVTVAIAAYSVSDWVQSRSRVLLTAVEEPAYETLNRATGLRLPIWSTALRMGADNWLNGVGPRGFRFAYDDYAAEDDERWTVPLPTGGARASHAHQLLLEIFSETGVPGLVGLLLMVLLLVRLWRRADVDARVRALPFALALLGMLFPLNTHAAWYSSWSSLMLWLFIGLYLFALADPPRRGGPP